MNVLNFFFGSAGRTLLTLAFLAWMAICALFGYQNLSLQKIINNSNSTITNQTEQIYKLDQLLANIENIAKSNHQYAANIQKRISHAAAKIEKQTLISKTVVQKIIVVPSPVATIIYKTKTIVVPKPIIIHDGVSASKSNSDSTETPTPQPKYCFMWVHCVNKK